MTCENFWIHLRDCLVSCCNCCTFKEPNSIDHDRLTTPSDGTPPSTLPRSFDNPVLECGADDNFTLEVLDTPELNWNPQNNLRLRFHDAGEFNDSNDQTRTSRNANERAEGVSSESRSIGRESGYGYSIEESLESGSENEYSLAVTESKSKATYKLIVEGRNKCWIVFRRQLEFVTLQECIREEIGPLGKDLPVGTKANIEELQSFLHSFSSDLRVFQIAKVREFLHLDRYKSSSSNESGSGRQSGPITTQPKTKIILDPKKLVKERKASTFDSNRKNEDLYKNSDQQNQLSNFSLGCEEKKMSPADFEFLSIIGKGSFGRVMLARKKDDHRIYAVKMLNKRMILRKNETAHVLSERSALTRVLSHPYIVQLHYAFTTPNKIFFVLDYVNGGELFYHLQKERIFSEKRARFYAAEMCCALTYMHSKGIVYRDLKPENILLDKDGHIVLTDFGLCKEGFESSFSRTSTFCGTPEYLAPEVILKKPYTRSVDWWTLGAVLYEMLFGLPPFYHKNTTLMYNAIIQKPLKLRSTISAGARDILTLLLEKAPINRLGSGPMDGLEVQSHFFFISINWENIEERKVPAPFVPYVKDEQDTRNIDPSFTEEPLSNLFENSPTQRRAAHDNDAFRGFTYVSPVAEPVET